MEAVLKMIVFISLVLGFAGAWFMSRYAFRFGLLDIPNNRSSHSLPTPRGGGIGILLAFTVSCVWLAVPVGFWVPATLMSLVSFFDDKLDLSPRTRLVFQFLAALSVVVFNVQDPLHIIQNPTSIIQNLKLFSMILPFCIFIVGTANFYNFMDGINGIAGITGAVGFALLGFFAEKYSGMPALAFSAVCISAACLGFLPFNIPRARVFMGDVGSILLGFVFASFVVVLSKSVMDFFLLAAFLSTFYADALTTLFIRKRDGNQLSQAHRRHLYQLFANQKGVAHWRVSVCYGIAQAVIGTALLALRPIGWGAVLGFEVLLFLCWWIVMIRVRMQVEDIPAVLKQF